MLSIFQVVLYLIIFKGIIKNIFQIEGPSKCILGKLPCIELCRCLFRYCLFRRGNGLKENVELDPSSIGTDLADPCKLLLGGGYALKYKRKAREFGEKVILLWPLE